MTLLGQPLPAGLSATLPRVGALVEGPAFYPYLSGEANLRRFDAANPVGHPSTRSARVVRTLSSSAEMSDLMTCPSWWDRWGCPRPVR